MKHFRVQVIPTGVSLANFLCGFASITYSLKASGLEIGTGQRESALYVAAMLIFFAMVADLLDGTIARMTGSDTAFGAESDSVSVVVSFCVAPAVLVIATVAGASLWEAGYTRRVAWILAGAYAAFGAMRLARYNVDKNVQPSERFSGLPSPAAAGAVVSLVLLYLGLASQDPALRELRIAGYARYIVEFLPIYAFVVGVLMVTHVRYAHLGRKVLSGRKPFPHLVVLALIVVIAFIQLEATLAAGFTLYVFAGLVLELYAALSGKRPEEREEEDEAVEGSADARRG